MSRATGRSTLPRPLMPLALLSLGLLSLGLLSGADPVRAQPPPPGSESDLDSQLQILGIVESAERVELEIALPAALGRLEPAARNFGLTEAGQPAELAVTPVGTAPTILAIDTSGSMGGPSLSAARAAAHRFIESMPADASVGLISFAESVVVHQPPTGDRAALAADLDGLETAGEETALWDALIGAAELLDELDHQGGSIVVLSDGDDTVSAASHSEAVEQLRSRSLVLYAVAIESPDLDRSTIEESVELVGGQFLTATDVGGLDALYGDIAGRLLNRYRLSFAPGHRGARSVVVSVAVGDQVATARATLDATPRQERAAPLIERDAGTAPVPLVAPASRPPLSGPVMLGIGAAASFTALLLTALLLTWPRTQVQLATATGADRLAGYRTNLTRTIDRQISRHDRGRRLDARLDAADIHLRPGELLLGWLMGTAAAALGAAAVAGPVLGILAVPIAASATVVTITTRTKRRRQRFAEQLTETLGIIASSIRAGQSLPQAIELVAGEAPSPTAQELQRIHFELRIGRDLTDSLRNTARRMESDDMEWLAQAVDVHRELGGDLTEILSNLAATIRERRAVSRQVAAMSAEGRATGWLLLGMPIILLAVSWWRTPESIGLMLTDPTGRLLLLMAAGGMVVGHIWIRHLVKPRY